MLYDIWFGCLPFEALEKIFRTQLFGLNEDELDVALNYIRKEWNDFSYEEKRDTYNEYKEKYSQFIMA